MFKQKKYLDNQPLDGAIRKYGDALKAAKAAGTLPGERILVGDSLGRVTSEAVIANISSPFYHSAAMDGYAVRFIDTFGASGLITTLVKAVGTVVVPVNKIGIEAGEEVEVRLF